VSAVEQVIAHLTPEPVTQVLTVSSFSAANLAELPWLCFGFLAESQVRPHTTIAA